jgi:hypothetical protein
MVKYLFAAAILLASTITASAQPAAGSMPGGDALRQFTVPNIGRIFGKILDDNDKPVSGATVVLLHTRFDTTSKKNKDLLLKSGAAKSNGDFSFEEVPAFGEFKLKVSATGFKAFEQAISIKPAGMAREVCNRIQLKCHKCLQYQRKTWDI